MTSRIHERATEFLKILSYYHTVLDFSKFIIMVESSFGGLEMGAALVTKFKPYHGWEKASELVRRRILNVEEAKAIFCFIGRADVLQQPEETKERVRELVAALRRFNPKAVIIISGPIPEIEDGRREVANMVRAGRAVREVCRENRGLEFSRIAEEFYNQAGPCFVMRRGNKASNLGLSAIRANVHAKITCSNVVAKYQQYP